MESSISNSSMSSSKSIAINYDMDSSNEDIGSSKSIAINYDMDSSNEDIDQQILRETGEQTISAEWSATVSALNSSDTISSNSHINIEILKECCANPSDTLKDKEDFMVFETSTVVNTSKFNANDTKYSECKTTAFQKKYKPVSQNVSHVFENILNDDSQMEITQNSICLKRFQKRKRLIPPNDEDFIEINNSNYSNLDNVEISMIKSPKFCFSKKKKDQFDTPDYNLSTTESVSITDDINISKIKENTSNFSFVVNDNSNNIINVSKAKVFTQKFSRKTINVPDTAFDNFINDSTMASDIALNNKNTSLNEISVSIANNNSLLSKTNMLNLNHTYDVPINTNYTTVESSISGDADVSREKQNTVFKKPSNSSILVNENSNNMDVSNTKIFKHKFNRKTIDLTNSAFDNIINDSSMTFDMTMNNKNTSLNENSMLNVNTPMLNQMNTINLNHTYNVLINTDSTSVEGSITDVADLLRVKQNTAFKLPSNSYLVNDNSSNITDISKTEVFVHKFSRKAVDVADSVFDNIINDSNITSDDTFNNKVTSSNETLVSNVHDTPGLSKIDISNLNHTYDIPANINTSKIDVSIASDNNIELKQNTDLDKSSKPSIVVNDSSNNIMDASETEVFTHKFSRKIIDVTNSVFDNVINDASMVSDITLNNKKVSLSNVNNTSVVNTIDISNLNHTYNIPIINNTTILDDIVENDKNMFDTPVLLKCNTSKSLNLLPLKFNFSNKIGRHSLSYQEKRPSFDSVKKHNISLNTVFTEYTGDKSNIFPKLADNSNVNIDSHLHISKIQESSNNSQEVQPLDDLSLLTNKLNHEQLKLKCSISSNSNNDDLLLSNTTKSLESNEFNKNQSTHSINSTSSNEGLTLLNSTTGLLESCSSFRNQSSLLTSKHSKSSISNNSTLNSTMESLDSNESQKTQSKRSISPSSYNESLKSTNSTNGFSGRRSSRNKSTSSNHSNVISSNDSLILLNTTMGSVESNKSLKTQSKRSISPSYNESLKSINSTTGFSGRRSSSRNKSSSLTSKRSTSIISNNDSATSFNTVAGISVSGRASKNKSQHSTTSILNNDNLTLLNTTTGLSISGRSFRNLSKCTKSSASVNESLTMLSNTIELSKNNKSQKTQSKRSISPSSYNESLKSINSTTRFSGRRSSRNKSTSSNHSSSVISNNDSLALSNTTMGSIESDESQETQLKHSISASYNESSKSTNFTIGFSGRRSSSRNKSSSLTSKRSTSIISNNDSATSFNTVAGISVSGRASKNKSQHSTTSISNKDNLTLLNATIGSLENNKSQKIQSKHLKSPTLNIEGVSTVNTTTGSLKQNVLSINQSNGLTSEYSSSIIGEKSSINSLLLEDVTNNVNRMSTRLSKQKSNFQCNVEPVTSIIIDRLTNSDDLTIKNITEPLEQKVMSINQSNSSPNISIKMSTKKLILEDDTNYINKIQSLTSKQENYSRDNIEQVIPNITSGSLVENRSSTTRILRSSLHINKNKSLLTRPLVSENVNNLSTNFTKTSKYVINCNNESFNNNSDDSLFWATLPDETTSISSIQNVNINTFQTPKNNKLIIAENIINTIKTMSTNKQKSSHPGAFELDDHNDGPLTRSFVKHSYNRHSPSILTLVFGGQKISESTSSLIHSLSETVIDQSQVEENIKQKFKSLYKKESWITKRLYKFLIIKLQPNYNIYSVKYAEKFVKYLAMLLKQIYNDKVNLQLYTDMLRYHMARYGIIKNTFDYLGFLSDYLPMAYYKKLVPGWNLETSAVKFDPQKYYIPLMDDEEFLNYIMKHLKET